jgi:UDP-GlcNAc:undecaprenyl-phosphate/decaprenyl-phosphate GlcNAc-1-phosphate transferase
MLQGIDFAIALFIAFIIGLFLTPVVIWLAKRLNVIDYPTKERKVHKKPTPLLGGLAIFAAFQITVAIFYFLSNDFTEIKPKQFIGLFISGLVLMIGGFIDDKYGLKPKHQIVFPVISTLIIIACGVGVKWLSAPVGGGTWFLDQWSFTVFWHDGLPYKITLLSDLFTFVWLIGMTYTTKILDGLDGLVSGVTVIGAIFIFLTALSNNIPQPDVALLCVILAGAFLAFLLFNFNPAKIFVGEGGSTFAGFMLGVLSIMTGSKVAVTLLLMGVPVLDVGWTIVRRLMEKKNPFKGADRKHLHYRLLDAGFSVKRAVLLLYALAVIFGAATLTLQKYNQSVLIVGILLIFTFILLLAYLYKKRQERLKVSLDLW